jgi:hypothetical protein
VTTSGPRYAGLPSGYSRGTQAEESSDVALRESLLLAELREAAGFREAVEPSQGNDLVAVVGLCGFHD